MADLEIKVDVGETPEGEAGDTGVAIPNVAGISKGIKGAVKGLGIASAIAIIADVVMSFKPLVTIVSNILKMLSMIFRPIADAVMILLMPILLMMKPIVKAVNQLMNPFIKLAMELMKEGEMGKATAVLLGGLSVVFIKLASEAIKMIGALFIIGAAKIFGIFSEESEKTIMDKLLPAWFTLVEDQSAIASEYIVLGITKLIENSNVGVDDFVNNATDAIISAYPLMSKEVKKALLLFKEQAIAGDLKDAMDTLNLATVTSFGTFGTKAGTALAEAFAEMIRAIPIWGDYVQDFIDLAKEPSAIGPKTIEWTGTALVEEAFGGAGNFNIALARKYGIPGTSDLKLSPYTEGVFWVVGEVAEALGIHSPRYEGPTLD